MIRCTLTGASASHTGVNQMHTTLVASALLCLATSMASAQTRWDARQLYSGGEAARGRPNFDGHIAPVRREPNPRMSLRRRLLIGAAAGAVVGTLVGGTYALLETTSGCKAVVGVTPCDRPAHLWRFPVAGALAGGLAGAVVVRLGYRAPL